MIIAIDIGGTKTLVARITDTGSVAAEERFETPHVYADFIKQLAVYVDKISTVNCTQVIAAVPAHLDRQRGLALAFGNLPWRNVPIRNDIEKLANLPVRIENDANLAALAESHALRPMPESVLYVTISTGIGIGFVVNGVLDPDLIDSEGGSMLFEHEGRLQKWEHFASGKAIVETYGKRAADIDDPHIWRQIAHNIAVGLYNLCSVLEPDHVVIGGGVGTHYAKFEKFLHSELKAIGDPIVHIPPITQARHPEQAVINGCIIYAKQHE